MGVINEHNLVSFHTIRHIITRFILELQEPWTLHCTLQSEVLLPKTRHTKLSRSWEII